VTVSSESDRIHFVGDIDAEPEPLRSQLWALVLAGASELDDDDLASEATGSAAPS
jgi:hypothetical protein